MGNDYYETLDEMEKAIQPMGIGNECVIHRAIVDKNCRVGDNVVIKGSPDMEDTETETYVVRDGIIVLKKGVHIPDGTVIGEK